MEDSHLDITLCALQADLQEAFASLEAAFPFVRLHRGSIFDINADAYVSPANSFGFMNGGIDALYVRHFGPDVETNVQNQILRNFQGELLVGQALVAETKTSHVPYLIAAPTMRVPISLGPETIAPFLAMRAILLLLREGHISDGANAGAPIKDHIRHIACPGLGTGIGSVPAAVCAAQIEAALKLHYDAPHRLPVHWAEAGEIQDAMSTEHPAWG